MNTKAPRMRQRWGRTYSRTSRLTRCQVWAETRSDFEAKILFPFSKFKRRHHSIATRRRNAHPGPRSVAEGGWFSLIRSGSRLLRRSPLGSRGDQRLRRLAHAALHDLIDEQARFLSQDLRGMERMVVAPVD